jgi:polysaccharide pyruvyl transferase WcaK-like protein
MHGPRIAVFGIFGRTNLGNEATLAAFLANLRGRFPGARVACIGPIGSKVREGHGIELVDMEPLRVRHHFWRFYGIPLARTLASATQVVSEPARRARAQESLRAFDALVVPGTGVLDDFGQGPFDLPHHLARWCRAATRMRVPVFFLSIGAEEVPGRLARRFLRDAVARATYRSFRDAESRRNAERIGVDVANDSVYPDLAFSLPVEKQSAFAPVAWPPRRVGVGIMGYDGWNKTGAEAGRIYQTYLEKITRFITWLLDRKHIVRLLTGDTRAEARPMRDLVAAFGTRVIDEPIRDYGDLLRQIPETDVVIASRFHNVILSLLLERPVLSLSYSKKNDALLHEYGMGALCQDIERFSVEHLIDQFESLARTPEPPTRVIRDRNAQFRAQLVAQYDRVFDAVDAHRLTPTRMP